MLFRMEVNKVVNDHQQEVRHLQEHITMLETELAKKESVLVQERQAKEDLINQSFAVAQSQDSERKSRMVLASGLSNLKIENQGCQIFFG